MGMVPRGPGALLGFTLPPPIGGHCVTCNLDYIFMLEEATRRSCSAAWYSRKQAHIARRLHGSQGYSDRVTVLVASPLVGDVVPRQGTSAGTTSGTTSGDKRGDHVGDEPRRYKCDYGPEPCQETIPFGASIAEPGGGRLFRQRPVLALSAADLSASPG